MNSNRYLTPEERRKAIRKRRRKANLSDGGKLIAIVLFVPIAITALIAFMTLPVYLAWNLGVVGISHALGGHIHHINFWIALGISLGIGVLSRIFRGPVKSQSS